MVRARDRGPVWPGQSSDAGRGDRHPYWDRPRRGRRTALVAGVSAGVVVVAGAVVTIAVSGGAVHPSHAALRSGRSSTVVPRGPASTRSVTTSAATTVPVSTARTSASPSSGPTSTVPTGRGALPGPGSSIAPSVTAGTAVPWSPTSPDTLVGASGNPADWPAARPEPPSLAGAYSSNMMTVFLTLVRYQDWVWSHPDPSLVRNYMMPGTAAYRNEEASISTFARRSLHADPSPTEIDWLAITGRPRRMLGKTLGGHPAYTPCAVTAVINQRVGTLLSPEGKPELRSPGGGRAAFSEVLDQGLDGRWRIAGIVRLHPAHGLGSLAG